MPKNVNTKSEISIRIEESAFRHERERHEVSGGFQSLLSNAIEATTISASNVKKERAIDGAF